MQEIAEIEEEVKKMQYNDIIKNLMLITIY